MKYDAHGLPILTDDAIEKKAYEFLSEFDTKYLEIPCKIPIEQLLHLLEEKHGVKNASEEFTSQGGHTLMAMTIFSSKTILFNRKICYDDMRATFQFTAAHEIGHWLLHSTAPITIEGSATAIDKIEDYDNTICKYVSNIEDFPKWLKEFTKDFLENPRKKKFRSARDWMEHHANVFAASLTMPRNAVKKVVITLQENSGIRRAGRIWMDRQHGNIQDYRRILEQLQEIFCVSKKALSIRLKKIGILEIDERRSHKPLFKP